MDRKSSSQQLAIDLEEYMMKTEKIDWKKVPAEAKEIYDDGIKERIPTGIGHHEKHGWFVLMSGQGPMIAYIQHKI